MADTDIIEYLTRRHGQSQDQRLPPELFPEIPVVDGRTPADLLRFVGRFAKQVAYYRPGDDTRVVPTTTWEPFFPDLDAAGGDRIAQDLLSSSAGTTSP